MNKQSKWLLLAPELYRNPGGIARVSRHYLQALAQSRGHRDMAVVALNDATITEDQLGINEANNISAVGCARSKIKCALALWRETRRRSVHVTCTHVALSPLLVVVSWFRTSLSFDVVVHGIEVWQDLPFGQRMALNQARTIFSVSHFTRNELVTRYPKLDGRCSVLPNALDPSFVFQASTATTRMVSGRILSVSRLASHDWEKGIDHLIEALPKVHRRIERAHLHIVGDGVDRPRLEELAKRSGLADRIKFLGRISDAELQSELANCEIFALPSRKEGFGLVYLEAMAAGKPCIVARAGGAPEVIDNDSGIMVPYGDVSFLADTLVEALRTEWNVTKIRQRAMAFAFSVFVDRWLMLSSRTR